MIHMLLTECMVRIWQYWTHGHSQEGAKYIFCAFIAMKQVNLDSRGISIISLHTQNR
jgi:hypothetical protein